MSLLPVRGIRSRTCPSCRHPATLLSAGLFAWLGLSASFTSFAAEPSSAAEPIQRAGAQTAFAETIGAPISPFSVPAPVRAGEAETPSTGAPEDAANQSRIEISRVRLTGNTRFGDAELLNLLRGDLGRSLSFAQLQELAARVQAHYHTHGYILTRVVIPRQDIGEDRVLEMRVLEGALEGVSLSGATRLDETRVRRTLLGGDITVGEPFKVSDLERALVRLNNLNGVDVSSTLQPGTTLGTTQVEVSVEDGQRITGSLEINNFGNESTGLLRIVPAFSLPNLTGRGDLASVYGVFSPEDSGLYFGQVSYTTPIGHRGWGAGTFYSQGNYQVGQAFEALAIEGENRSFGLGTTYAWVRSARSSVTFEGWFEASDMEQTMLASTSSEDKIRKLRIGANLDRRDLTGRTFISAHIHQGLGETLGAMEDDSPLSSRSFADADNSFTKLVVSLTRLQSLRPNLFLVGHLAMQYAIDPVVASEQIFIGGANSVRGHPQSAHSGDDGFVLNLEARYSILPGDSRYQVAAFLDHGQVHTKEPVIGQDDWHRISGAGVGGRVTLFDDLELRLDLGVPLGEKSGADVYLYAQARYRF